MPAAELPSDNSTRDKAWRQAETRARSLTRLGNPGVGYEAAPVTGYASCRTCLHPVLEAAGQWWHCNGDRPRPRQIRDAPGARQLSRASSRRAAAP